MSRKSGCGLLLVLSILLFFVAGAFVLAERANRWPGTAVMPSAQLPPANR